MSNSVFPHITVDQPAATAAHRCPVCGQGVEQTTRGNIGAHYDTLGIDICPMAGEPFAIAYRTRQPQVLPEGTRGSPNKAAARIFAALCAFALGGAIVALLTGMHAWFAGAAISASLSAIAWGLAKAIADPDDVGRRDVSWRVTQPFGVERVITRTRTHRPARGHTTHRQRRASHAFARPR